MTKRLGRRPAAMVGVEVSVGGVRLCGGVVGRGLARAGCRASRRVVAVAWAAAANGCAVELGCPLCAARANGVRAEQPVQERRDLFRQLVSDRGLHVRVRRWFCGAEL